MPAVCGRTRLERGRPRGMSAALPMRLHGRNSREVAMAPQIQYARNGDVSVAYETFGDTAEREPLLLIMGLDFQMIWWPDAFCQRLVASGFSVVRFDNRDTGLSTHFSSPARQSPWRALWGRTEPAYTALDMVDDAQAVMDAVGWSS